MERKTYDEQLYDVLQDVRGGQHLHHIGDLFRTEDVCFEAVRYRLWDVMGIHEFYCIPMGNLDAVVARMRKLRPDAAYNAELDAMVAKRREKEAEPGYYGEFANREARLQHYGAADHDSYLRICYAQVTGTPLLETKKKAVFAKWDNAGDKEFIRKLMLAKSDEEKIQMMLQLSPEQFLRTRAAMPHWQRLQSLPCACVPWQPKPDNVSDEDYEFICSLYKDCGWKPRSPPEEASPLTKEK